MVLNSYHKQSKILILISYISFISFTKQSNLAGKKNSIKRNNDDAFIQNESKIETLISV